MYFDACLLFVDDLAKDENCVVCWAGGGRGPLFFGVVSERRQY